MMKKTPNFQIRKNVPIKASPSPKPSSVQDPKQPAIKQITTLDKYSKRTESEPGSDQPVKLVKKPIENRYEANKLRSPKNVADIPGTTEQSEKAPRSAPIRMANRLSLGKKDKHPNNNSNGVNTAISTEDNSKLSNPSLPGSSEKKVRRDLLLYKNQSPDDMSEHERIHLERELAASPQAFELEHTQSHPHFKKPSPVITDKNLLKKDINGSINNNGGAGGGRDSPSKKRPDVKVANIQLLRPGEQLSEKRPINSRESARDSNDDYSGAKDQPKSTTYTADTKATSDSENTSALTAKLNPNVRGVFTREHITMNELQNQKDQKKAMKEILEFQINEKKRKREEEKMKDKEFEKKEEERIRKEMELQAERDNVMNNSKQNVKGPVPENVLVLEKQQQRHQRAKNNMTSSESTMNTIESTISKPKLGIQADIVNDSGMKHRIRSPKMQSIGRFSMSENAPPAPPVVEVEKLKEDYDHLREEHKNQGMLINYLLGKLSKEDKDTATLLESVHQVVQNKQTPPGILSLNSIQQHGGENRSAPGSGQESLRSHHVSSSQNNNSTHTVVTVRGDIPRRKIKIMPPRKHTPEYEIAKLEDSGARPPKTVDTLTSARGAQKILTRNPSNQKFISETIDVQPSSENFMKSKEYLSRNMITPDFASKVQQATNKINTPKRLIPNTRDAFNQQYPAPPTTLSSAQSVQNIRALPVSDIPRPPSSHYETANFRAVASPQAANNNNFNKSNVYYSPGMTSNLNINNHFNFNTQQQHFSLKMDEHHHAALLASSKVIEGTPSLDRGGKSEFIYDNHHRFEYGSPPQPHNTNPFDPSNNNVNSFQYPLSSQANASLLKNSKSDSKMPKGDSFINYANMTLVKKPSYDANIHMNNSQMQPSPPSSSSLYGLKDPRLGGLNKPTSGGIRQSMSGFGANNILVVDEGNSIVMRNSATLKKEDLNLNGTLNGAATFMPPPSFSNIDNRFSANGNNNTNNNLNNSNAIYTEQQNEIANPMFGRSMKFFGNPNPSNNTNNNTNSNHPVNNFEMSFKFDGTKSGINMGLPSLSTIDNNNRSMINANSNSKFPKDVFSTNVKKKFCA
jgi:hypothetical protein